MIITSPALCNPSPKRIAAGHFSVAKGFMSANLHFPHPSYERPPCPKCGATMMLSRLDREDSDHGKRTFDCIPCDQQEAVIVQYR